MSNLFKFSLLYITLIIAMLLFTKDLTIENDEAIFLTKQGLSQFKIYSKEFGRNQNLILMYKNVKIRAASTNEISKICEMSCEFHLIKSNHDNSDYVPLLISSNSKRVLKKITRYFIKKYPNSPIAGPSYINTLLDNSSMIIGKYIFPLFYFLMGLVSLALFRSIILMSYSILPTIFTALIGQSLIKLLFETSNIIISISPLLISILVYMMKMHISFGALDSHDTNIALRLKIKPIIYMALSTAVGFLSLYFSPISLISTFGLFSGSLLIFSYAVTLLIGYILPLRSRNTRKINIPKRIWRIRFNSKIFSIGLLIPMIGLPTYFKKVDIEKDASNYFSKKFRVKEKLQKVITIVDGTSILEIIMPIEQFKGPNIFRQLSKIEDKLKNELKLKIRSANEGVIKGNKVYSGVSEVPASSLSYYPIYSKLPSFLKEQYPLEKNYRISILGIHQSGEDYDSLLKNIGDLLEKERISYHLEGEYYRLMEAQNSIINTLSISFLITILIIGIFVALIFKDVGQFCTFIIVNIAPIMFTIYLMPLVDISLNIATVMAFSISIGLMVDSTFHMFYEKTNNYNLNQIHTRTVLPIFWGNIILGSIFFLFNFVEFLPIRQFGQTMGTLTLIGLIFDLFVLPEMIEL